MSKGYWVTFYRSVSNPSALAAYAKLAGPAITLAEAEGLRAHARSVSIRLNRSRGR